MEGAEISLKDSSRVQAQTGNEQHLPFHPPLPPLPLEIVPLQQEGPMALQMAVAEVTQRACQASFHEEIPHSRSTVPQNRGRQTMKTTKKKTAKVGGTGDMYDVFLSYRVNADQKLVENIYFRLKSLDCTVNGKIRKLRVFWDAECLLSGEGWEEGFSRAICSSTVVVLVLSRGAFANIKDLKPDSRCDNYLLEHRLALHMNSVKGARIFPLLVGDKKHEAGEDFFTHYFRSKCYPDCPDIVVQEIEEKAQQCLGRILESIAIEPCEIQPCTVKEVFERVLTQQGHFVHGPESNAIREAAQAIHECAQRSVTEQETKLQRHMLMQSFELSTPQGQEVLEWLFSCMLSHFAQVFARNALDSLWKISKLSDDDVSKLNHEYCVLCSSNEAQTGNRIRLAQAVQSLRDTKRSMPRLPKSPWRKRAKSLQHRLTNYRDSSASADALIGAQNQLEYFVSKARDLHLVVVAACAVVVCVVLFALPFVGIPLYTSVASEAKETRSVTSYMLQLSLNSVNWSDVLCEEPPGTPCIFDSSAAASNAGLVAMHRLPRREHARYVRVIPRTWLGSERESNRGGDFRLGIMGGIDEGPSLDFTVVEERGQAAVPVAEGKHAWLQLGCHTGNGNSNSGRWAMKEEEAGRVQCCLSAASTHVCTRDGCLAGSHNNSVAVDWHEAQRRCGARGWRLCSRQELERKGASGCCGSQLAKTNRCGYDTELVWTSTVADAEASGKGGVGRLHSSMAFEGVRQLTVDLLATKQVDALQIQGGVGEVPLHGTGCFVWMWTMPLGFAAMMFSRAYAVMINPPPTAGVKAELLCWMCVIMICFTAVLLIICDVTSPGVYSGNPICKTQGPTIYASFMVCWIVIGIYSCLWLVQKVRPEHFIMITFPAAFGLIAALLFVLFYHHPGLVHSGWIPIFGYLVFTALLLRRKRKAQAQARSLVQQDIDKYDEAWRAAGGISLLNSDISRLTPVTNQGTAARNANAAGSAQMSSRGLSVAETRLDRSTSAPDIFSSDKTLPGPSKEDCLKNIRDQCQKAFGCIIQERNESVARLGWRDRLFFRARIGPRSWQVQPEYRYGRTGKYRQRVRNIDQLFEEAKVLNDHFLQLIEDEIVGDLKEQGLTAPRRGLICAPIKRPDRALQKVVRKYYRDPSCLTDIVRCCLVLPSIESVDRCLEIILSKCTAGSLRESGQADLQEAATSAGECRERQYMPTTRQSEMLALSSSKMSEMMNPASDVPEESERGGGGVVSNMADHTVVEIPQQRMSIGTGFGGGEWNRLFKLVKIKDRFTGDHKEGYRDICLNVEVAWTISSESEDELAFVPVCNEMGVFTWDGMHGIRTHVCEIQLMLESMYNLKEAGSHGNFVKSRDLLAK